MIHLKPISGTDLNYAHIVGTGGIGSGIVFLLRGNQALGRNESRMANLLPCRDYCKQHIIMHYVSVLLGAQIGGKFQSFPIGKVGNDHTGDTLVRQMKEAGMNTKYISISANSNTLFSVCYQYPDHSGGNITSENSASGNICPDDISRFFTESELLPGKEIILSVPEVPLNSRIKLLQYGRERHSLNVAAVLSSEIEEFKNMDGFTLVDILSVNIDEAGGIARLIGPTETKAVIDKCIETLLKINPGMTVLITDGSRGSYCYHQNYLEFTHALSVEAISTAGAGDAFLAGVIAGLSCKLPLTKGTGDNFFSETPLASAVELGTLLASLSITSEHTIHPGADAEVLHTFAKNNDITFTDDFSKIFKE